MVELFFFLLFDDLAEVVDADALEGVVLIELEVVELVERRPGLVLGLVGDVEGLVADAVLLAHLHRDEAIFLPYFPFFEDLLLEEVDELVLVLCFEEGNADDWVRGCVLMNWLRSSSSSYGFLIFLRTSLYYS